MSALPFFPVTPMSQRNLPPSFWDQNHKPAISSASSSSATTTSASSSSYSDFYSSSSSASDPLQAAGLSGALHQLAADWQYPSAAAAAHPYGAAARGSSYAAAGYPRAASDYWARLAQVGKADWTATAADYHQQAAAAAAALQQHGEYYAAAHHYSNMAGEFRSVLY